MIEYYATTQKGRNHIENEDRVMVCGTVIAAGTQEGTTDKALFATVSDGVGGHPGGAKAAQIVSKVFGVYGENPSTFVDIRCAAFASNSAIRQAQRQVPEQRLMSTTVAGIWIRGNSVTAFNIGDSRVYRYAADDLELLTCDHTRAWELFKRGSISDPRCAPGSYRRTLERYLGGAENLCVPSLFNCAETAQNSTYLICSDGVWGKVSEPELTAILASQHNLREKSEAALKLALQNGSTDDMSIILINYSGFLQETNHNTSENQETTFQALH